MKFICTLSLLFCFSFASAQRCATEEYINNQPFSKTSGNSSVHSKMGRDLLNDEVIIIPVVVHVVYNNQTQNISDQQILSQIKSLNDDFRRRNADTVNTPNIFKQFAADTKIQFCLAKVDPSGKPTTGIIRKFTSKNQFLADDEVKFSSKGGVDAWDATKYLNIWVCNLFGRTLGYSVLPGGPSERDGVVLKYNVFGTVGSISSPYNKGRTATHEIGHWLGLHHLWGNDVCGDDGIDDTPRQQASNTGCTTFPRISTCSENQYGDMFMNYMDFSDDACMNLFTIGQKNAMRKHFAKGGFRNSFLESNVCGDDSEAGPLPVDSDPGKGDNLIVKVYPNPFAEKLIISSSTDNDLRGKTFTLYGATGIQIRSIVLQSQTTILETSQLPAGIYFGKIDGVGKSTMIKLAKLAR
ncbi:MAG: M43 family zinc metalloprotease [Ginsengibacter sp.]